MKEKTCYYCGTKYPFEEECCPVCGQKETVAEEIDEIPADLKPTSHAASAEEETVRAPRRRKKKKNVFATLLCIILALAVVACVYWILSEMKVLPFRPTPADETSLDLPVETVTEPETPAITGITANPDSIEFRAAGQKKLLQFVLVPEGAEADPSAQVSYVSADPAIAEVSETGEVAAVAQGETTITVQYAGFTAECPVKCDFGEITAEAPETSGEPSESDAEKPADENQSEEKPENTNADASLSKTDFTLFTPGEKAKIAVLNAPSGSEVVWSSKNESVATVSGGVVSAVAPGTTNITATVGGKTLTCIVRCRFAADSQPILTQTEDGVKLSHEDVTLKRSDETFRIKLLSGDAPLSGISWSSTNASVCSVDADGTVHAAGSGTAKIIGSYNGSEYVCIVRCNF